MEDSEKSKFNFPLLSLLSRRRNKHVDKLLCIDYLKTFLFVKRLFYLRGNLSGESLQIPLLQFTHGEICRPGGKSHVS